MVKIITHKIDVLTRQLSVRWTLDREVLDEPKIDISKLTTEEQADLIIKKLSETPNPKKYMDDEILTVLVKMVSDELDKEILKTLTEDLKK